LLEQGYTAREIAAKIGCRSYATVLRLKKNMRKQVKLKTKSIQADLKN
jgi:hypothetical protein